MLRLPMPGGSNVVAVTANADHLVTLTRDARSDVAVHDPKQYRRLLRVWKIADLKRQLPLPHKRLVAGVRFTGDGRLLASFDTETPEMRLVPESTNEDAHFIVTNAGAGSLNLWDVATHERRLNIEHPAAVFAVDITADGTHLASAAVDGAARVFGADDGHELARLQREGWIYNLHFGPDGRILAVASGTLDLLSGGAGQARLSLWDWGSGETIGEVTSDRLINDLAFSADGRLFAAGRWDGTLYVLNLQRGGLVAELANDGPVRSVAISHDGYWLAAGTGGPVDEDSPLQQGKTLLWHLGEDTPVELGDKHAGWVMSLAFLPDDRLVASVGQDGRIGVWEVASGDRVADLSHGAASAEAAVHFSPDGRYLVSAVDRGAKIWDLESGREVARREHALGSLHDAVFSPDGRWLATASTDTTVALWLWRPDDLIAEACDRVVKKLTEEEWKRDVGSGIGVGYHPTCAQPTKR
jgi:WD40 repeat protein